jgi:hypothetical protein
MANQQLQSQTRAVTLSLADPNWPAPQLREHQTQQTPGERII